MPDPFPTGHKAPSPGTYLRLRRVAAGVSLEALGLATETDPPRCARERVEWLRQIEADVAVIGADVVEALQRFFSFDRHVLYILVAIHAGAELDTPAICASCGCSWSDACVIQEIGRNCRWSADDPTRCSAPACRPATEQGSVAA